MKKTVWVKERLKIHRFNYGTCAEKGGERMNKTKIEWCDYTWNPVTGCLHRCGDFCYAKKMAYRLKGRYGYPADEPFRPTFRPERIREPLEVKKSSKIFVVSMGDLFGDWVPSEWINSVLDTVEKAY